MELNKFSRNILVQKFIPVVIFLISLVYMSVLTGNIPFYWDDFEFISKGYQIKVGQESFAFVHKVYSVRPLRDLYCLVLYFIFGYNAAAFHIFKAVFFAIAVTMVYNIAYHFSRHIVPSVLAAFFFMTVPAILESTMWICDSEIVAEAFMLMALYMFLRYYRLSEQGIRKKGKYFYIITITVCAILGNLSKESARMFPVLICSYMLLYKPRSIITNKGHLLLIGLSIFSIFLPTLFVKGAPLKAFPLAFFRLDRVGLFIMAGWNYLIRHVTDELFWFLVIATIVYTCFLIRVKAKKQACMTIIDLKGAEKLLLSWFSLSLLLLMFYNSYEHRQFVIYFIPASILLFILLFRYVSAISKPLSRVIVMLVIATLLFTTFKHNIRSSVKYRKDWGGWFIGMEKVRQYFETISSGCSLILYKSVTVDYPNYSGFKNQYQGLQYSDAQSIINKHKKDYPNGHIYLVSLNDSPEDLLKEAAEMIGADSWQLKKIISSRISRGPMNFYIFEFRK